MIKQGEIKEVLVANRVIKMNLLREAVVPPANAPEEIVGLTGGDN